MSGTDHAGLSELQAGVSRPPAPASRSTHPREAVCHTVPPFARLSTSGRCAATIVGQEFANASANNGAGQPWIDLDGVTAHQQVSGRVWTILDTLDLATDQKVGGSNPSGCAVRAQVRALVHFGEVGP
jgi:hypothetical protein